MSNTDSLIKLRRSAVEGKIPTTEQLQLGEIAINTFDGKMFIKQQRETEEQIIQFLGNVPVDNTIFVQKGGSDTNAGTSWSDAYATVEQALQKAFEREGELTLIDIGPGTYETEGHLDVPDNCMIRAAHRTVVFRPSPGFEERNVFRLGSGCFIEGPIFEDFRLDDLENPTEGFAVVFRPDAMIRRAPYAHKIAVRTTPTWDTVPPPLDRVGDPPNELVGRGAGVVLADGAVCSPYSIYPNIMTWGATPVSHNGIGYCAKNGALINAVNAVSLWAHKHFLAIDGGQIILSACSTQFGDFTMVSKGVRHIVVPTEVEIELVASEPDYQLIDANRDQIIDDMWDFLVAENYTETWTEEDEEFIRRDAANFLQSISWVIQTTNEKPMLDFARSLFNTDGTLVYSQDKEDALVAAFEYMRDEINDLAISQTSKDIVTALVAALTDTILNTVTVDEPSLITAIGHTWSAIMKGVALTNIPPASNSTTIQESILELDGGEVIASGQDDQGSALFIGGLEINADTGELTGPPFDTAVNRIATRVAISRSF